MPTPGQQQACSFFTGVRLPGCLCRNPCACALRFLHKRSTASAADAADGLTGVWHSAHGATCSSIGLCLVCAGAEQPPHCLSQSTFAACVLLCYCHPAAPPPPPSTTDLVFVLHAINGQVEIFAAEKSGKVEPTVTPSKVPLIDMAAMTQDDDVASLGIARVAAFYDEDKRRYVLVWTTHAIGDVTKPPPIFVAVSHTQNPLGAWVVWALDLRPDVAQGVTACAEQPPNAFYLANLQVRLSVVRGCWDRQMLALAHIPLHIVWCVPFGKIIMRSATGAGLEGWCTALLLAVRCIQQVVLPATAACKKTAVAPGQRLVICALAHADMNNDLSQMCSLSDCFACLAPSLPFRPRRCRTARTVSSSAQLRRASPARTPAATPLARSYPHFTCCQMTFSAIHRCTTQPGTRPRSSRRCTLRIGRGIGPSPRAS